MNIAQSLSKIYLHIIFHTKSTSPIVKINDLPSLHAYIGKVINSQNCTNIWVGGVSDHVHILCELGRGITVSDLLQAVKINSSKWMKKQSAEYSKFSWQIGYAAFSVSQSNVEKTLFYIKNQEEHHRKTLFIDEYKQFLRLYHIEFDERFVFDD